MNKITKSNLSSRIPKSSIIDHQTKIEYTKSSKFRNDKNLTNLKFVSLRSELINTMPTIKEEKTDELSEDDKKTDKNNRSNLVLKDDSTFTVKLTDKNKSNSLLNDKTKKPTNLPIIHKSINKDDVKKVQNYSNIKLNNQFKIHQTKSSQAKINQLKNGPYKSESPLSKTSNLKINRTSSINQKIIKSRENTPNQLKKDLPSIKSPLIKQSNSEKSLLSKDESEVIVRKEEANKIETKNNNLINQSKEILNFEHTCRICLDTIDITRLDGSKLADCGSIEKTNVLNCLKDDDQLSKDIVAPCACKGQSKYVHKKCLSEWIYVSKRTNCQVCLVKFRNIKISVYRKSVIKWLIDEYDHLLMLILYLIPFMIDCILILNFLTYDFKINPIASSKLNQNLINPTKPNLETNSKNLHQTMIDENQLDKLEKMNKNEINKQTSNDNLINNSANNQLNLFSYFINFKRTQNLSRTMSLNMFIHNLYFLEIKFFIKNYSIYLNGIPVTLMISLPSLILFIRYCRSRYREWQNENLEVSVEN